MREKNYLVVNSLFVFFRGAKKKISKLHNLITF